MAFIFPKTGENTLPIYAFHWCIFFVLNLNPFMNLTDIYCFDFNFCFLDALLLCVYINSQATKYYFNSSGI